MCVCVCVFVCVCVCVCVWINKMFTNLQTLSGSAASTGHEKKCLGPVEVCGGVCVCVKCVQVDVYDHHTISITCN